MDKPKLPILTNGKPSLPIVKKKESADSDSLDGTLNSQFTPKFDPKTILGYSPGSNSYANDGTEPQVTEFEYGTGPELPRKKLPTLKEGIDAAQEELSKKQELPDNTIITNQPVGFQGFEKVKQDGITVAKPKPIDTEKSPSLPEGQNELMGKSEFSHPINSFTQGFTRGIADMSKSISIMSKKMNLFGEYGLEGFASEKKVEDLAAYKFATGLEKFVDREFPLSDNDREAFMGKLAQGAGSMIPFLLGGMAGKGMKYGKFAIPALMGAAQNGGSEYQLAINSGADDETAFKAFVNGAAIGTLEGAPIGLFMNRMNKATGGAMSKTMRKAMAYEATALGAIQEGSQEAVSQTLNNVNAMELYDKTRQLWDGVFEAGMIGGILGGTINTMVETLHKRRQDPNNTPQENSVIDKTIEWAESKESEIENQGVGPEDFYKPEDIPAVKELKNQKNQLEQDMVNEELSSDIKAKIEQKIQDIDKAIEIAKEQDIASKNDQILNKAEADQLGNEIAFLQNQAEKATSDETKSIIQQDMEEKLAKLEELKAASEEVIWDDSVLNDYGQENNQDQTGQEVLGGQQENTGAVENIAPVVETSPESPNFVENGKTTPIGKEGIERGSEKSSDQRIPAPEKNRGKGKTPIDQRKLKGRKKLASELEVSSPLDQALQYFIRGGHINTKAIESLYGGEGRSKQVNQEALSRISYWRRTGKSIDEIAHDLWENQPTPDQFDTSAFREAVEEVIKDHTNPAQMAENLLEKLQPKVDISPTEQEAEKIEEEIAQPLLSEDFNDESFDKAVEHVEQAPESKIETMAQDDWINQDIDEHPNPWDDAIDALEKLKIDTKNTLGAFGLAPEIWNSIIDGIQLAIKGGKKVSEAVSQAIAKAKSLSKDFDEKGFKAKMEEIFGKEEVAEPSVSGIKKALVPEDVIDSTGIDRRSNETMLEQGKQAVDSGEVDPETIINEIANFEPRALQPIEVAALVYYKTGLDNKIEKGYDKLRKAVESKDYETELAQRAELAKLEQSLADYQVMSVKTAYEQSLAFRLRKMLLDSEYKLQTQINRYKAANDGVLPAYIEEKMRKYDEDLKAANDKIEQLEKDKKDYLEQQAVANIREDIERQSRKKETAREKAKTIADKIRQGKTSRPSIFSNATPASLAWDAAIEITAKSIEASGMAIDAIQKGIQKGLEHIRSTKWYKDLTDQQKAEAETGFENYVKENSVPKIQVTDGKVKIPHSVIREFVEQGITDIDDLAKAIHDQLKTDNPSFTLRGIRDAITGYGKTLNLNKEDIEVQIRKMKRIGRLISGLEDVRKKLRPLRSGLQRDKLSTEERMMLKELNNEMKSLPVEQADLDKAWKSALDGIKTRLQNNIEELEKQIADGAKLPRKQGVAYDAEALALKAKRDALRDTLESMIGKPEMSDEQRVKVAIASAERSLKDLEQRIKDGELLRKKKPSRTPQTPELLALKEQVAQKREVLKQMQEQAGIPEVMRLENFKKRTQDKINELNEKLRNRDFTEKPKKPPMDYDAEALRLEAEKIRIKDAYDLEFEKLKLSQRSKAQKIWDGFLEIINLPKTLLATADMSAPLRQGLVFVSTRAITNPIDTGKRFADMFKMAFSEKYAQDYLNQIKASPAYPLLKESKLYIADQNAKLSAREEQFVSSLPKRIPILKYVTKASERAYVGFLNKLRIDVFLDGAEKLSNLGLNPKTNPDEYKAWADYVNNATGRGTMGQYEQAATNLSALFFSPRLIAARFNTLFNAYKYASMPVHSRKMALKQTASFIGIMSLAISLSALYLNDDDDKETSVESDPRSSDFGKIKIKNTRIDIAGGFQPFVRIAAQLLTGEKKSITTGKISKLGEGYKPDTRFTLMRDFFANKLAPIPSLAYKELLQPNPFDKNKTAKTKAIELIAPLAYRDMGKLYREHGAKTATLLEIGSFFGMGIQDFGEDKPKPFVP